MKRNKGMQLSAVLAVILIVSMAFAPAVSAKQTELASDVNVGEVTILSPKIEVKENTKTSSIYQVNDILISLKSNAQHTEAVMTIEDLVTKEKETIDYKVSKKSGEFTNEVYYQGELVNTYVTDYDILEPGVTGEVLKNKNKKTESADIISTQSTYWWDSVFFVSGYGIKYPHPDVSVYRIQPWENKKITGNQLIHRHLGEDISFAIANAPPAVAGGLIIATGGTFAVVVGVLIGIGGIAIDNYVLLDETGCIWTWEAKSWGIVWFWHPALLGYKYVPKYFRVASFELWDKIGIGNP
ncbi:MAG: hypothetical protein SCH39_00280 [Methanosarcinales archaeon]|nr:hypothetical protein [Methanosarcinales archaeon]